jgi:hypothetical protein
LAFFTLNNTLKTAPAESMQPALYKGAIDCAKQISRAYRKIEKPSNQ